MIRSLLLIRRKSRLPAGSAVSIAAALAFLLAAAGARADDADAVTLPASLRQSRRTPAGFLRYELPEGSGRVAGPLLALGAVLLATDRQTLRQFDADTLESGGSTDPIFRDFNFLADGRTLGASLLGLYALGPPSGRDTAAVSLVALTNAAVAATLLKSLTGKERPAQSGGAVRYHGPSISDASFPSGHTAAATAVACVLAHDYPKLKPLWYGLAGAVAYSRIASGEHFPSDVFFGAGIGIVSAEGALRHRDQILAWRF